MKTIFILLSIVGLVGCCGSHETTVELVVEKDGCKVYRVREHGMRSVYFTDCRGSVSWSQLEGKITRDYKNETVTK